MTRVPRGREPEPPEPQKLVRWTSWTGDDGELAHGFERYPSTGWDDGWAPPCPDGNPQRLRRALGFRERSLRELELRVALGGADGGVCQVIVEEHDEEVYVRVLVCQDEDGPERQSNGYTDCPVRVWLDEPLGMRAVIDVDSDEELPLFIPSHLDNVPQPDHGYHQSARRQLAPGTRPTGSVAKLD